jgi:hypothetical protein
MSVVVWLVSIFVASLTLGACLWFAVRVLPEDLEGPWVLAMLIVVIAGLSSGVLLLLIGPTALYNHFQQIGKCGHTSGAADPGTKI